MYKIISRIIKVDEVKHLNDKPENVRYRLFDINCLCYWWSLDIIFFKFFVFIDLYINNFYKSNYIFFLLSNSLKMK